ncbi:hypothetical protein KKC45_03660, partial [Patescibacteria group bacterium]|nr:hypothetical protein [Patescibacteria group bacterium]
MILKGGFPMLGKRQLLMVFVEEGLLDESKVDEILATSEEYNLSLGQFVVQRGYLSESQFLQIFAREYDYEYYDKLDKIEVPNEFCKRVSINFARNNNILAIGIKNGAYQIATCSPLLTYPIDELSTLLRADIDIVLAPKAEIVALINTCYKENIGV